MLAAACALAAAPTGAVGQNMNQDVPGAAWAIQGAVGHTEGVCSAPDDPHDVRCCSDTEIPGYWQKHDCTVWTQSVFRSVEDGDGCVSEVSLATAEATCTAEGARLCTRAELEDNCAQGTGCGHDSDLIWTSDGCGEAETVCASLAQRMAEVSAECCDEAAEECDEGGTPTTCNLGCADVLIP
eukprot:SAG22_NODE_5091_length_1088_cov_5.807077_1_plen_182_part_01